MAAKQEKSREFKEVERGDGFILYKTSIVYSNLSRRSYYSYRLDGSDVVVSMEDLGAFLAMARRRAREAVKDKQEGQKRDAAHEEGDRVLSDLEKRVTKAYSEAARTAEARLREYLEKFEKQDEERRGLVAEGKLAQEEYEKWRRDKVINERRWRQVSKMLGQDLTDAAKISMSIVNGQLPEVYAENYNWGTYEVEHGTTIETVFTLYDRSTVATLLRDQPDLYPQARVNEGKDVRWNSQHVTSAVTQGLLLGEPMDKVAKRISRVAEMSSGTAIRAARTCITAAENLGRVDSYRRAENLGIKVKKQWLATLDRRTRSSHRALDGESVGVNERFSNGLRYPGDSSGAGSEVYNCRCTLVADLEDFPAEQVNRASKLGDMTYAEWKQEHRDRTIPVPVQESALLPHVARTLGQDYVDAMDTLLSFTKEQDAADLYRRYGDVVRIGDSDISGGAFFSNTEGTVSMNARAVIDGDDLHRPYQTAFHEFAHAIDFMGIGDGAGPSSMAASVKYRDAAGRSLRDVLADDWEDYQRRMFAKFLDDRDEDMFEALYGSSPRLAVYNALEYGSVAQKRALAHLESVRDAQEVMADEAFRQMVSDDFEGMLSGYGVNLAMTRYLKRRHPDVGEAATVSDALEGLTDIDYPLGSGHGRDYHHGEGNTALEFFAEVLDSKVCNPAALEFAREVFPGGVSAVEEILREAIER